MLIKRLEIRNCRKIKQAEIDLHGPGVQVLQGPNASGKTTVGQAIRLTLEGPKAFTPGMISLGETQAEVVAICDDGVKIRTQLSDSLKQNVYQLDETTGRYTEVSGGVRSFLNSIRSGLESPWAMRDMTDAKIIELLKERCGISERIGEIDEEISTKERLRTDVGRDKKRMGTLKVVTEAIHPAPADELTAERNNATEYVKWLRGKLDHAEEAIRAKCRFNSVADIESLIPLLKDTVTKAKAAVSEQKEYTQADIDRLNAGLAEWAKEESAAKDYDDYLSKKQELEGYTTQYDELTVKIEELRALRKKTLADMNLGVEGLEIGEDNMLYHNSARRGITESEKTSNWSTAESIQVFFSLGVRFSGKLKILIVDNAESLDVKTSSAISQWAEKSGSLVILLKVADLPEELEEQIIYLKEGEVVTK